MSSIHFKMVHQWMKGNWKDVSFDENSKNAV